MSDDDTPTDLDAIDLASFANLTRVTDHAPPVGWALAAALAPLVPPERPALRPVSLPASGEALDAAWPAWLRYGVRPLEMRGLGTMFDAGVDAEPRPAPPARLRSETCGARSREIREAIAMLPDFEGRPEREALLETIGCDVAFVRRGVRMTSVMRRDGGSPRIWTSFDQGDPGRGPRVLEPGLISELGILVNNR